MILISLLISALYSYILYRKTKPEISLARASFLFSLRLITLWIVLMFLLLPVYKVTRDLLVKPKALVLIDNSASMDLLQEGESKAEQVSNLLDGIKGSLETNFEVEYFNFASSISGNKNNTDLLASIEDLYQRESQTPHEIFLLSDGYFSDNRFSLLKDYPFKINTFEFSNPQKELQAKIVNIRSNRNAYLNEDTPIEISVNNQGKDKLSLEISNDNQLLKRKIIESSEANITKELTNISFEKVGLYNLNIKLLDNGEQVDSSRLVIKVSDNKKKLVMITDSADWDLKFIKDAIKLDNRFSYRYIILKDRVLWEGKKEVSLPDLLADCQLLILNNKNRLIFNQNQNSFLANKIKQGLNLFLIGDIINGLEEYYPVAKSNIDRLYEARIIPGYASKDYTTFAEYLQEADDLPPVKYYYYRLKNTSQEIATFDNMDRSPAITSFRLNTTKVLHFAFQDFWRFSTRVSSNDFNTMIRNILQWLSSQSGQNFLVATDKDGYYFGETVNFTASILDEKGDFISQKNLELIVKNSEGQSVKSDFLLWKSQEYTYKLADLPAGKYTYQVTDLASEQVRNGQFLVYDNSLEMSHLDFNNVALNEISKASGGYHYKSWQSETFKQALEREKIPTQLYREFKILFNNYLLFIVILSFSIELFFRRRWGLI